MKPADGHWQTFGARISSKLLRPSHSGHSFSARVIRRTGNLKRFAVWRMNDRVPNLKDLSSMADIAFDTPEAAEAAFYAAFAAVDLDLMEAVWAEGDNILCIHPGSGLLRGKAAVMKSWSEIFSGSAPPAIEYRCIDGYAAVHLAVRVAEELIRPRGEPPETANRVLATNVFLFVEGSWRLGEHHASLPLMVRSKTDGDVPRFH